MPTASAMTFFTAPHSSTPTTSSLVYGRKYARRARPRHQLRRRLVGRGDDGGGRLPVRDLEREVRARRRRRRGPPGCRATRRRPRSSAGRSPARRPSSGRRRRRAAATASASGSGSRARSATGWRPRRRRRRRARRAASVDAVTRAGSVDARQVAPRCGARRRSAGTPLVAAPDRHVARRRRP